MNTNLTAPGRDSLTCRRCGSPMKAGLAIAQTWTASGVPDFPGDAPGGPGATMSAGGPGKLIPAMKCIECGHSLHV